MVSFVSTSCSYKVMEGFFSNFEFVFKLAIGQNQKNIQQGCVYVSEVGEAFVLISIPSS